MSAEDFLHRAGRKPVAGDINNVAGPRQTEWAEGYDYAFRALDMFLSANRGRHESD